MSSPSQHRLHESSQHRKASEGVCENARGIETKTTLLVSVQKSFYFVVDLSRWYATQATHFRTLMLVFFLSYNFLCVRCVSNQSECLRTGMKQPWSETSSRRRSASSDFLQGNAFLSSHIISKESFSKHARKTLYKLLCKHKTTSTTKR